MNTPGSAEFRPVVCSERRDRGRREIWRKARRAIELDHPDLYNGKARRATAIATATANPTLHYGVTVRVAFMLGWKRQ